MAKKRLDVILYERGLVPSREKAKATVMSGIVYVNGVREDKPGTAFTDDEKLNIELRGSTLRYVSRGGLKLEKAIDSFGTQLEGLVCMDIGASTGGFTDCMLQNGARKVFAVDVGYGQLDWKLRNDDRVVNLEKTNIRYIEPETIGGEELDFASCDVSFISLSKVLPAVRPLLKDGAYMVCLIKPQFEAGREEVGKKGVVRDRKIHVKVIDSVLSMAEENGFSIEGLTYSPVKGPEGNIEYLVLLRNRGAEGSTATAGAEEMPAPGPEGAGAEAGAAASAASGENTEACSVKKERPEASARTFSSVQIVDAAHAELDK